MSSFWTGGINGIPMPKRQSRFLLYVGGIPTWVCKSVTKPSYSIGESAHRYINHTFYFPGRLEWNAVDATLVDPLDPDISRAMLDITKMAGYHTPTNEAESQSLISKAGMVGALGTISIHALGPPMGVQGVASHPSSMDRVQSSVIEKWHLHNAWIQDVNFGSLSYDTDELVEVGVKFRYDYAEFEAGLGSSNLFGNA
tara:strand:- start:1936 stop:2529 length:594 start_codon:yes stop_codon:yes gene_type:complete